MQQQMRMQQMAQLQQNAMQREGSTMEQRPASPSGGGDAAPSPKRQRLEGNFNGAMGPMGRGQPPGMPGQQVSALSSSARGSMC
jgi:hypothetical protein